MNNNNRKYTGKGIGLAMRSRILSTMLVLGCTAPIAGAPVLQPLTVYAEEAAPSQEETTQPQGETAAPETTEGAVPAETLAQTNAVTGQIVFAGTETFPEAITVNLLANNVICNTIVVNSETKWAFTFSDLPLTDANGAPIVYTVEEVVPEGFVVTMDGTTITNTWSEAAKTEEAQKAEETPAPAAEEQKAEETPAPAAEEQKTEETPAPAAEEEEKTDEAAAKAEQDKKAAEEAAAKAEQDKKAAEEAAAKAEQDKKAAEEAAAKAEQDKKAAKEAAANTAKEIEEANAAAKKAEEDAAAAKKEAEEAKKTAEEAKEAAEKAEKKAEEAQKAAEEANDDSEKVKKAEEKAKKAKKAKKRAEEKAKKAEEAQKKAEEKAKKAEEAKKQAEEKKNASNNVNAASAKADAVAAAEQKYHYVTVKYVQRDENSSNLILADYRSQITEQVVNGYHYVGFIPAELDASGAMISIDLVFEKD